MIKSFQKSQAVIELLTATFFWGFGFVAAVWAMASMGPLWLTAIRFLGAFALTAVGALLSKRVRANWTWDLFKLSAIPGLLLGLTLLFQTWGLSLTTAGRSGFLTGLYVVFVPLLEKFWFRKKLRAQHWLCVMIALIGTSLIVNLHGGDWNWGDVLVFICSLLAGLQIVWMGRISSQVTRPLTFNAMQSLWAGGLCAVLAFVFEAWPEWPGSSQAWFGLLALTFGGSWLAFALQVKSQKVVSASLASLLFLLESPLALIFGVIFLKEQLTMVQMAGAGLILLASLFAIRAEQT